MPINTPPFSDHISNATPADVLAAIQACKHGVLLLTHAKPDGDALGSLLGLKTVVEHLGKSAVPVVCGPLPTFAKALPGTDTLLHWCDGFQLPTTCDLAIVCDTGAIKQLGPAHACLEAEGTSCIVIDHHLTGDLPAPCKWIDSESASCAEMVAKVLDLHPEAWDESVASLIYAGMATDTGWFRFANATPGTFRRAADLIEKGVRHALLFEAIEHQQPVSKLALMSKALNSLEFNDAGTVATMCLSIADFEATHAGIEETEGIVNLPLVGGTVQASALLTERMGDDGETECRVSFRAKPAQVGQTEKNVADVAAKFGGGGHAKAAGATLKNGLFEAQKAVFKALADLE